MYYHLSRKEINMFFKNINKKCSIDYLISLINIFGIFLFELHRIIVSSFLIIPQFCGDNICNVIIRNDFYMKNNYYNIFLFLNLLTLISYFIMYIIELKREYILISYLYYDKDMSIDSNDIINIFQILPKHIYNKLTNIQRYYFFLSYITFFLFFINTFVNGYIIYNYFYYIQYFIIFVTNTFFMLSKLTYVYNIINVKSGIYYSAYLVNKYQFNDITPEVLFNIQKNIIEIQNIVYNNNKLLHLHPRISLTKNNNINNVVDIDEHNQV
jgi:hypothetical protein